MLVIFDLRAIMQVCYPNRGDTFFPPIREDASKDKKCLAKALEVISILTVVLFFVSTITMVASTACHNSLVCKGFGFSTLLSGLGCGSALLTRFLL
ncbi:MAG: hypothetical protein K940chlam9_00368 [Chlamydiae bacterium]|nr:hypothetical protein [Chlamydiota bacterium]